jgi:hypothetical protein
MLSFIRRALSACHSNSRASLKDRQISFGRGSRHAKVAGVFELLLKLLPGNIHSARVASLVCQKSLGRFSPPSAVMYRGLANND